jgi:hypothetical protein
MPPAQTPGQAVSFLRGFVRVNQQKSQLAVTPVQLPVRECEAGHHRLESKENTYRLSLGNRPMKYPL